MVFAVTHFHWWKHMRSRDIRSGTVVFPWESRTLSPITLLHMGWEGGDETLLRLFQLLVLCISLRDHGGDT